MEPSKIKNPLKEDLEDLKNRYFMKQSYDKSLTDGDRSKLKEVIEEKKVEENRIEMIKKQRELKKMQREEKLKKLQAKLNKV